MEAEEIKILAARLEALQALADQEAEGPRTGRGEFVHDATMAAAIAAKASELGGGYGATSKAVRALIMSGARYEAQKLARKLARA